MKALLCWALAGVVAIGGLSQTRSAEKKTAGADSAKKKLIGAWRLVSIEEQGPMEK
jgi:hypothetical protein